MNNLTNNLNIRISNQQLNALEYYASLRQITTSQLARGLMDNFNVYNLQLTQGNFLTLATKTLFDLVEYKNLYERKNKETIASEIPPLTNNEVFEIFKALNLRYHKKINTGSCKFPLRVMIKYDDYYDLTKRVFLYHNLLKEYNQF